MFSVETIDKTHFIFVTTLLLRTQQPEVWQRNTCVLLLLDITLDSDTLLSTSLCRSNYQAPSVPEDPLALFHQVVPESQSSQVLRPPPLNQSDQVLQVAPTLRTVYVTNWLSINYIFVKWEAVSHPFTFLSLSPFRSCEPIKTSVPLQTRRMVFTSEQFFHRTTYLACTFGPTSPSFPGMPGAPVAPMSP